MSGGEDSHPGEWVQFFPHRLFTKMKMKKKSCYETRMLFRLNEKCREFFYPIKSHTMHVAQVCHTFLQRWLLCKYLRLNKIFVNIFFCCLCQRWNWAKNQISKRRKKYLIGKILLCCFFDPLKCHLMCSLWFMIDLKFLISYQFNSTKQPLSKLSPMIYCDGQLPIFDAYQWTFRRRWSHVMSRTTH